MINTWVFLVEYKYWNWDPNRLHRTWFKCYIAGFAKIRIDLFNFVEEWQTQVEDLLLEKNIFFWRKEPGALTAQVFFTHFSYPRPRIILLSNLTIQIDNFLQWIGTFLPMQSTVKIENTVHFCHLTMQSIN